MATRKIVRVTGPSSSLRAGDKIAVTIRGMGAGVPELPATVLSVERKILRYRYDADAEMFAGLTGMIRMPGWVQDAER